MRRKTGLFTLCSVLVLSLSTGLLGQTHEPRSEVELPLSTYDALRAAAKEQRVEVERTPWASARLLRGSLAVDLAARRGTWEAEIAVVSLGEEPPAIRLIAGAASIGRSSVTPDGAAIQSDGAGTQLVPEAAGTWRVVVAGEIAGQGDEESAQIRFELPRLSTAPSAFDLTLPADAAVTVEGGVVTLSPPKGAVRAGRVTLDASGAAALVVSRVTRPHTGPPLIDAAVDTVVRLTEESVRSEVRLWFQPRRGALVERRAALPRGSLVSVSGPVLVEGPGPDGMTVLRFEPPVPEREAVTVVLSFVTPRKADETSFTPDLPRLPVAATDRLESSFTVVSGGGLLLTPAADGDWSPRAEPGKVRVGSDETALGFESRERDPRPPAFTVRQLKALAVASALSRVSLTLFVGESGETRTQMVADVRSRGRAALRFRVPESAAFLAARVDGRASAVSRPAPDLLELPIDSASGRTRVELLLGGRASAPRVGERLTLEPVAPDEAIERVSWSLVLPPGLGVKEEPKALAPLREPPAPRAAPRDEAPPAERAAAREAARLAAEDRRSRRDGFWSPEATLPKTPVAYTTELADVEGTVPSLQVTITEKKEASPWF